jgi:hypothetical protein
MRTSVCGRKNGQTVMETAVLFMIIVFAFVAMQVYLKRGVQGRIRASVDQIGGQYDFGATTSESFSNHVSNSTTYTFVNRMAVPQGTAAGDPLFDRTVTTSRTETLYDNSFSNGYEQVMAP